MAAVRRGVGREEAHEVIKEHAVAVALEMRHGMRTNDLLDRLAADPRLRLTRDELGALVTDPLDLAGTAGSQVARIAEEVAEITATHPEAAAYRPGAVL